MRESIKNKVTALKAKNNKVSTEVKSVVAVRDITNSLSKAIRNNQEADAFKEAYSAAIALAKMK